MKTFSTKNLVVCGVLALATGSHTALAWHGGGGGGSFHSGGMSQSHAFNTSRPRTQNSGTAKNKLGGVAKGTKSLSGQQVTKVGNLNLANSQNAGKLAGNTTPVTNTGGVTTGSVKTGSGNVGNINTGNVKTGGVQGGKGTTGNTNTGGVTTGNVTTGSGNVGNINTGNVQTGGVKGGSGTTGNTNTGGVTTGGVTTGSGSTGNINTGNIDSGNVTNINRGGGFGGFGGGCGGLGGILGGFSGGYGGGYAGCGGVADATPAPVVDPTPAPAPVALADLQPIDVKQMDSGVPAENLGPRFRVTVLNDGTANVNQEFAVTLTASDDAQATAGGPSGSKRVRRTECRTDDDGQHPPAARHDVQLPVGGRRFDQRSDRRQPHEQLGHDRQELGADAGAVIGET